MKTKRFLALFLMLSMLIGVMPMTVFAEEECAHTNTIYTAPVGEPSCFEPAMGGYWFCEDCYQYLDENKQNVYWDENEVRNAVKRFATGHAFNTDTGKCDHCDLANPVYSKVTSLTDINEEDMYIFVAKVGDKYFVLGGLDESTPDEQGNVWCGDSGNAIEVTPYEDGSISLLNQDYVGAMKPSEFMFDVNPDQWNFTEMGLTTVMPLLPNYCVYPFQSNSLDNTGYMGVPRYGNGEYGMWDSSAWILDFYTTVVTDETYRYEDEFGSKTHAEQVADGNIDENISEGDLLLYKASFYSVGGAMFTLRFREYPNPETGTTEYYFICGEDWALEGSPGWDYVTDTTPTNDTQYAISLYRYDVPSAPAHTCDFGDWVDDKVTETHTRTCKDTTCGKTETLPHNWDEGVQSGTANCLTGVTTTYTCTDNCGATKSETAEGLGHDWNKWTDDGESSPTDTHSRTCKRNCGVAAEIENHNWSRWTPVDDNTHKKTCSTCTAIRTTTHNWAEGVVAKEPTEFEEGLMTYTCGDCAHTKGEPIPKLNHNLTFVPAKDPTCTEDGNVAHYYCGGCQRYYSDEAGTTEIAAADVIRESLGHDWSEWTYDSVDSHIRNCKRNCGVEEEFDAHNWGEWTVYDDNTHRLTCSICHGYQEDEHDWNNGVETVSPTCYSTGVMTYTCGTCGHTKTEEIPMTEHTWSDWAPNGDENHKRDCLDDNCDKFETLPHEWDNGVVTTEPSCTEKGVKTYTCQTCQHTKTEDLPKTDHQWTDWSPNGDGTHTRACRCNANETKDCEWDDGVITKQPTHYEEGVKTFTCTVCKATKTESIAKTTAHEWGDWAKKDDKSHIRECKCGTTETKDHAFDAGTVTKEPTHLETGVKKFTCADCGFVREDVLNKTPEHTFGEWKTEATVVGKHYRECACGEREIGDCTWDAGVVTTEPTYEATGAKTYTCTVCGGTKTETIDMLVKAEEIVSPENSDIKITTPEGSNAVLNENTVLKVEEVKDEVSEDVKANVEIVVGNDNAEVLASYDISLILDGATVQPGGTVEITLPAPENAADFDTLQVVYIDDDGNVTPCETRVNADGTVTFVTDHFSHYAIIGVQNSSPVVWILISAISVALIAGAVVAVLVIKKKKGIA